MQREVKWPGRFSPWALFRESPMDARVQWIGESEGTGPMRQKE